MTRAALSLMLIVSACSPHVANEPSLAPRAAEAIDPRLPIDSTDWSQAVDPVLAGTLAELVADARQGDAAFQAALPAAEAVIRASGPRGSESWITAQQALSNLESLRAPVTKAAADIDELAAERSPSMGAADLAALKDASDDIHAIAGRSATAISQLSALVPA